LNGEDVFRSESQMRVRGKGHQIRFLPLASDTVLLLDHYLRLERPEPCGPALFVSLKGPARGARMTPAGMRSLFRHHRRVSQTVPAHPHRFRHTFASDMVRAGISLPARMQLTVLPPNTRACGYSDNCVETRPFLTGSPACAPTNLLWPS